MISTIAMPSSSLQPAQQLEDLRLHRHVERGRRLVGDQHASARSPAPSRSSRAGACRPRARAGRRRRAGAASGIADQLRAARPRGSRAAARETRRGAPASPPRSARRRCRRGAARTAGPGRSSRCRRRAAAAARRRAAVSRSSPVEAARGRRRARSAPRVRPITVSVETLLPEPDSPTIPSVRPGSTASETPSTACTSAVLGVERDAQVLDARAAAALIGSAPAGRGRRRRRRRRGSR